MNAFPKNVKIVEVGPRDGLQNEKIILDAKVRAELINLLSQAGLKHIEAGSFVNPKWVPQMAETDEVLRHLHRQADITLSVLTPNLQGYQQAVTAGASEVAVFAAASESFSKKNINCSINESMTRSLPVMEAAKADNIPVRGYLSCIAGCPYGENVNPDKVAELALLLFEMGCYEISLADTIGTGSPDAIFKVIQAVKQRVDVHCLAVHCHDTYGNALSNIRVALDLGVAVIDSSVSGLGGCPFAPGAAGNVATEDVVSMLDEMKITHGIHPDKLRSASDFINRQLGRSGPSRIPEPNPVKEGADL